MLSPTSSVVLGFAAFLPTFVGLPSSGASSAAAASPVFGFVSSFASAGLQSLFFAGAGLSSVLATLLAGCGAAGSVGGEVSSIRLSNGDGARDLCAEGCSDEALNRVSTRECRF